MTGTENKLFNSTFRQRAVPERIISYSILVRLRERQMLILFV